MQSSASFAANLGVFGVLPATVFFAKKKHSLCVLVLIEMSMTQ